MAGMALAQTTSISKTGNTAPISNILINGAADGEGFARGPVNPFQPRIPGCQPTANCQEIAATGTSAAAGRASCCNAPTPFIVADDFRLPGTGVSQHITNICWWGYYGLGATFTAGNEAWRIRILPNLNGLPDGNNPIAVLFVGSPTLVDTSVAGYPGPTGGTNLNGTSGVFSRGAAVATSPLGAPSQDFPFTVTGLNITVPTNTCVWLEIGGCNIGTDNTNRTRWSSHSASPSSPTADNVVYQTNLATGLGYTYGDLFSLGSPFTPANCTDRAWCIGTTEGGNIGTSVPSCAIPAAPANSLCTTATNVTTLPFNDLNTNTLRATLAVTPYCGLNPVNGNTIWYKYVGTGTTVTVDTCGANTNFDTVINVYCGATCGTNNASLNCVANNDDAAACTGSGGANVFPSRVSFVATNGVQYDIAVFGLQSRGFVDVHIESDGVQAAIQPACVSDRCPVSLAGITVEVDACGVTTNSDCAGPGVGNFVLNTPFGGTNYNSGAARDFDFWHYSGPALTDNGDPGVCWLLANYAVEYPALLVFYTGACPGAGVNPPQLGAANGDYRAFQGQCGVRGVFVNAASGIEFWVNPTTQDFGGIPCAAGSNNYRFNVTLAAVGSCCQTGLVCTINPQAVCAGTVGSVWAAAGTCAVDPCNGVCCTGTVCATSTFDGCVGGTYTGGVASCTPNPCAPPGVCCRGATCNTTITTSAACTASLVGGTAGAAFPTAAACNTGAVSSTPCCYANYNKVNGVTVTDIFDFLGDWFAGSPFANTGGTGAPAALSVQNIFDFLTNWFNGGCS